MASVNQNRIALSNFSLLLRQRVLKVLGSDDFPNRKTIDFFICCDVDQNSASENRPDIFNPQALESVGSAKIAAIEAVVKQVLSINADTDMSKTVELGSNLTNLRANEFIMTDKLVLPGRALTNSSVAAS